MPEFKPIPILEELEAKHKKWDRIEKLMEHDEDAFGENPFFDTLPNETEAAKDARRKYFIKGFINISQDLVTAPGNAIMKNGYNLEFKKKDSMLSTFAENVTMGNDVLPFEDWLKDNLLVPLRAYGTVFTVIDKPNIEIKNRLQEREVGMPYLSNIRPQDVVNYRLVNGELIWFVYRRNWQPLWEDPLDEEPGTKDLECIWTKTALTCRSSQNGEVVSELSMDHNFGFVPVIIQASFLPKANDVLGVAAFEQTSNMIISFNNFLNIAGWELLKHGASLLLMQEESITATNAQTDDKGAMETRKQDKGGVLLYGGDKPPEYLVKELAVKEALNLAQYYATNAVENERDLKSVSKTSSENKLDTRSGFSKALDREPLENNLCGLAQDGELYSDKVFNMVAKMVDVKNDASSQFVKKFDLRSAQAVFTDLEQAMKARIQDFSPLYMKELVKGGVPVMVSDSDKQEEIYEEIDNSDIGKTDEDLDNEINMLVKGKDKDGNPIKKGVDNDKDL